MNSFNFISRSNYDDIDQLNELLKKAGVVKRITIKIVDNIDEFGVIVAIPSIFNPDIEPYEVKILEEYRDSPYTILQLVESINYDVADLLKVIKPDFVRLTRIKQSFDYVPSPFWDEDNTRILNINIEIHENYDRHKK